MEACPGLHADPDSFDQGMEFLKTRFQDVFKKIESKPNDVGGYQHGIGMYVI
jgi:hypothetical protein